LTYFLKLKKALISALIMQDPDWELPFAVMCDASDYTLGIVFGKGRTTSHMSSTMHAGL